MTHVQVRIFFFIQSQCPVLVKSLSEQTNQLGKLFLFFFFLFGTRCYEAAKDKLDAFPASGGDIILYLKSSLPPYMLVERDLCSLLFVWCGVYDVVSRSSRLLKSSKTNEAVSVFQLDSHSSWPSRRPGLYLTTLEGKKVIEPSTMTCL